MEFLVIGLCLEFFKTLNLHIGFQHTCMLNTQQFILMDLIILLISSLLTSVWVKGLVYNFWHLKLTKLKILISIHKIKSNKFKSNIIYSKNRNR